MPRMLILIIALFLINGVGCSSITVDEGIHSIHVGMDKDDVLELAGSPWITRRVKSKDHWVYRYYRGEDGFTKKLIFSNGKLEKVFNEAPYNRENTKLNSAKTMEQFEKAADESNKNYSKGFKDIDGSKSDD